MSVFTGPNLATSLQPPPSRAGNRFHSLSRVSRVPGPSAATSETLHRRHGPRIPPASGLSGDPKEKPAPSGAGSAAFSALCKIRSGLSLVIMKRYRTSVPRSQLFSDLPRAENRALWTLTPSERIARAKALVRKFIAECFSLSDELIADLRREASKSFRRSLPYNDERKFPREGFRVELRIFHPQNRGPRRA